MTTKNKTKTYNIIINCVVIGTDIKNNKQYILSLNEQDIQFPSFSMDDDNKKNIEEHIVDYLKTYVAVNELELMPQLISLNHSNLSGDSKKKKDINVVYSSLVNYGPNINNCYWIEFDFLNHNKYINLLFEVIQKLK